MNSSLYGKIEKAKRYEQEKERISFQSLVVSFKGEHDTHEIRLDGDDWSCNCSSFPVYGTCSHVMAMQNILSPMLSAEARYGHEMPHVDGAAEPENTVVA